MTRITKGASVLEEFLIGFGFVIIGILILVTFNVYYIKENRDKNNQLSALQNKIDTKIKIFDCRIYNRENIIIGIENKSLINKVKQLPYVLNETHLIDNPFICNETLKDCIPYFDKDLNETVNWMVESQGCDVFYINLSVLV